MPDIDNVMGVDAGDIASIMGVGAGDISTFMGVTLVTSQAYEGQTFLISGGNTDPFSSSTHTNSIQKKSSTSNGNSSAFGDDQDTGVKEHAATGGGGRGITAAGGNLRTTGADNSAIHYVTIASDGNAADTNDNVISANLEGCMGGGNGVKMGIVGGFDGALSGSARYVNTMQRYTIAGGSDASDIGDLYSGYGGGYDVYSGGSSTRWIMAGGYHPDQTGYYAEDINYMTWSSEGDASDAGDLMFGRTHGKSCVNSEAVVVFGASTSYQPPTSAVRDHQMDWVNPATTNNAADFGDDVGDDGSDDSDSATRGAASNHQDGTRGEFWCGSAVSGNSTGNETDSIRYITIASAGDSTDAGNDALYDTGRNNHAGLSGT